MREAGLKHGNTPGVDLAVFLGADPEMALVHADSNAWYLAFDANCECEGLCVCPHNVAGVSE
jgi:hypothetical protein